MPFRGRKAGRKTFFFVLVGRVGSGKIRLGWNVQDEWNGRREEEKQKNRGRRAHLKAGELGFVYFFGMHRSVCLRVP